MIDRSSLLSFEGVSRSVLEARIEAFVAALDALDAQLQGRVDNAHRTVELHSDWTARIEAAARACAYRVALADLRELVVEPVERKTVSKVLAPGRTER